MWFREKTAQQQASCSWAEWAPGLEEMLDTHLRHQDAPATLPRLQAVDPSFLERFKNGLTERTGAASKAVPGNDSTVVF